MTLTMILICNVAASRSLTSRFFAGRNSPDWDDLAWLRAQTRLPLLIKGILHPDDARMAMESGCDGIVVSSHGGARVERCALQFVMLGSRGEMRGQTCPRLARQWHPFGA